MSCFPMFCFKLILSISGLSGKTRYIFSTTLWFGGIGLSFISRQLRLNVRRLGAGKRRHERAKLERELERLQLKANNGNSFDIEQYLLKKEELKQGAFSRPTDQLHGFEWFNDYIPENIFGQFIGNIDCSRTNWESKIQKINNIVDAWRHRDLSFNGKAFVINGILTSTLWYNATSLSLPSWAVTRIGQAVYRFFWIYKHPL